MIFSDLKQWEREQTVYPEAITKGLQYIRSTDFSELPLGKHEIDGELMFALLQEPLTQGWERQRPESHRTYTDIQLLLSGEELIRVVPLSEEAVISEESFDTRDIAFYSKVGAESDLVLKPGLFAVFYPGDIHRPCCSVGQDQKIRKVVIKVHKSLLGL
ncbi:YhcH/YjgK/YiaL family protein [Paenibacillus doosanensis]|uniref:YhcH/YjgK/YiaL family protein n=1 Tax=Paenibacillus doosanensis TaxID=1229154 RepID=UPI00217FB135|nr:YhcH/YjgK/YiaL family protein [Paenibacillus doosanensis]MCS7462030.1 YhcH/YjgK/YiaL family protein [Paenibacillus doosanensis]